MEYQQITSPERYIISHLRKQGFNPAQIAHQLGRHRSTIGRELARNSCWRTDGAYRPSKASERTNGRRSRSRRNQHYSEKDYAIVRRLLRQRWSPEQITGHLKRHKQRAFSHETIYRYIWTDQAAGGDLWRYLRGAQKQRRKRYGAYDSRGRMANKRHISQRPPSVAGRRHKGHWEIDTVMGKGSPHCIVTLVERKTGFVVIGQLNDRTTRSLNRRTIKLIRRFDRAFRTITADNGTEFHQYAEIETRAKTTFYFATPYHSWERGTNENTNGLIRQYLPKGTSMRSLTQQQCDTIALKLNTRPRKRFDYRTPQECFYNV